MNENRNALRRIANEDGKTIAYRPSWNRKTGGVTATILLQQIEFRYANNGDKPFYKFKAPCQHPLYKAGDSWTEELGFSIREFDTALTNIGQKINKDTPRDPEKLVWYWTNADRLTHYELNVNAYMDMLERIYVNAESAFTKMRKAHLDISENTTKNNTYVIADAITRREEQQQGTEPTTTNQEDSQDGTDPTHVQGKVEGKPFPPIAPVPPSRQRKTKPPADPASNAAWEMYLTKLDEYEPGARYSIAHSRERDGINRLVKARWTAEQIGQCFDRMKADDFYADKHLSSQAMGSQIAAKLNGKAKSNHSERQFSFALAFGEEEEE